MAFYLDMTSTLNMFKTKVTVYPDTKGGSWVDGEWQENKAEPVTYYEPFIPNSLQTMYSLINILRDTGHVEQYNAVWISAHDYPTQTLVEHNGKKYRITQEQDLKDYSNVSVYYLQSEEGNDGNV